jgi:NADPH:quinone reductase-like Zn-dependent oxidoreductase
VRTVRFHGYGGPEALQVERVSRPEPGPDELLLEVTFAGVTLPVVRLTRGGPSLPHAPGGDVVGRVVGMGANLRGWRIGQRAAGMAFSGAYAEFALVNAGFAAPVPDDVSDEAALALVRGGQVALGTLHVAGVRPGDSVLVTAAAGGVGHLTVQLAKLLGAGRVVAAVGSASKADFVRGLGADDVVVYAQDWGEPVDIALDGVGGDVFRQSLNAVKPFGRLITYNGVGGSLDVNELRMRNQGVIGFSMAQFAALQRDRYDEHRDELWKLTASGELSPVIHRTLPLDQAAEAHRLIEARENLGRVLLSPAQDS